MRAHSLTRSLGTLLTGTPHSSRATPGNVLSVFVRRDESRHLSFVLDDPHGFAVGTLSLPQSGRTPTIISLAMPLHDIIWAWRQGLRMANLDFEITAFDSKERRLFHLEGYLRSECSDPGNHVRQEIARFQSVNLKLINITPP